jgi:hypothetical protein
LPGQAPTDTENEGDLTVDRPRARSKFKTLASVVALCGAVFVGQEQSRCDSPSGGDGTLANRMGRGRLLIGAYYLTDNLHDDKHVQEVADAGIDFLVAVDAKTELLDLCQKHKIGVIASSNIPMWWGDNGQHAGQYREKLPLEKLDAIKESYQTHPALWGDYPVDEPNVKDFVHVNDVIKRYHELFPGQLPYVNLYPIYASTLPSGGSPEGQSAISQLGTTSYKEHIDKYVELVDTDYICFDSYPFTGPFATYLENLDIVAAACRQSGRDMWVIIQSGAWKADAILGEHQIRWQAYLCLAYGTRIIMHASYSPGWWDESTSCVNKAGEKNVTYDYVQAVNTELRALSDVFMQYDNVGVFPCGDIARADARMADQLAAQTARNTARGDTAASTLLAGIEADGPVIAGCFTRKDQPGHALMLVNARNPWDPSAAVNVRLNLEGHAYIKGVKTRLDRGLTLESGEGVFITVE